MNRRADEHADTLAADSVAQPSQGPEDGAGDVLAERYQLLELLGSGGMGTVYRARDSVLEEDVALKTLRREIVDSPGALERFRREVKLARKVTHPHIARVFDVGEDGPIRFLTMELVRGQPLARVLAERGHLAPHEVARIGAAVCEGLQAAHAAGVVHRDLKPDNVLVETATGRIVVTDFGVARAMAQSDDVRATSAGGIVGTPAYMAPEQVDGSAVDARADLYALGVMLFELSCGALPFEGGTALTLAAARLVRAPRSLRALRPDVPERLAEVVMRALARPPEDRFSSAREMGAALATAVTAVPLTHASLPPAPRAAERRIAVLPIRTPNEADAWLAQGFGEDMSDALSMLRGVRVRARAGAPSPEEDIRAYARRHGVEAIVDGTVRRDGDRFRASLRLAAAGDGCQIWARRFDGTVGDALRISDEAAHAIAGVLAGAELPQAPRQAVSREAAEHYLRARTDLTGYVGMPAGRRELERALEHAPDDPTILAAYASVLASDVFRPGVGADVIVEARRVAARAIELAPHASEPHRALARVAFGQGDELAAMESAVRAVALSPSQADAHDLLGRILGELDALPEARAHFERALWIDPRLFFARVDLVRIHTMERAIDRVTAELDALHDVHAISHALAAARAALWLRRPDLGVPIPESTNPTAVTYHGLQLRALDRPLDQHDWELSRLTIESSPPQSRARRFYLQLEAELRVVSGDLDGAVRCLTDSVDAGLLDLAWLRRCPLLEPIRDRPAYAAHLATLEARVRPCLAVYREAALHVG